MCKRFVFLFFLTDRRFYKGIPFLAKSEFMLRSFYKLTQDKKGIRHQNCKLIQKDTFIV